MSHTPPDATSDLTARSATPQVVAPQPDAALPAGPQPARPQLQARGGDSPPASSRWRRRARVVWAVATIIITECVVLGLAVLPAVSFWTWLHDWSPIPEWAQVLAMAMAFVPAYIVFALGVALLSALAVRVYGWQTPGGLDERLADMSWPVLNWGRYLMTIHVVRVFSGPVFRSTPLWVMYLRFNGARIGRAVWVNSLKLMDHSLLEFGDQVVIGSDAAVSGHIIEHGRLKTAPVRLGERVTIGIGSVVGIGTTVGPGTQVGALSVVPKFSVLEPDATYAGAPVRRIGG